MTKFNTHSQFLKNYVSSMKGNPLNLIKDIYKKKTKPTANIKLDNRLDAFP